MSGSDNTKDDRSEEQPSSGEQHESGTTGEGAASALAHMISQGQRQRRHSGDADDAAGGQRS
ncbi:hypothetical protein [Ramlibacter sp.]|uniref:hypothetical protein n=1 Tax=Ramlibacter sp. TaxID=1917967 RepID=UPI002C607C9E|nr:hypothetical protein [Ramlibacter sp.]HWI82023.1 hypothetical protein [Ramlibacter sp.]